MKPFSYMCQQLDHDDPEYGVECCCHEDWCYVSSEFDAYTKFWNNKYDGYFPLQRDF